MKRIATKCAPHLLTEDENQSRLIRVLLYALLTVHNILDGIQMKY